MISSRCFVISMFEKKNSSWFAAVKKCVAYLRKKNEITCIIHKWVKCKDGGMNTKKKTRLCDGEIGAAIIVPFYDDKCNGLTIRNNSCTVSNILSKRGNKVRTNRRRFILILFSLFENSANCCSAFLVRIAILIMATV